MPRRKHAPHPKTRAQRAVEVGRDDHSLGNQLLAIDIALKRLNARIDKAVNACLATGSSGSVVGSVVQVPVSDPAHERAIDWLDAVQRDVEALVSGYPG